jgi:ERCC4-type nuclease
MQENATCRPIEIIADDRERTAPVIVHLQSIANVIVTIRRLRLGDYLVDQRLLFERKSQVDLPAAIVDGRLLSQSIRLAASNFRAVLVLEGSAAEQTASGVSREAVQGALIAVTVLMGIPILRSDGPDETARLLLFAARQLRSAVSGGLPRHGWRPKGKRAIQLRILQGLPQLGPARAERLLDAFGSVEAVLNAAPQELCAIRGIGADTAKKIRWALS